MKYLSILSSYSNYSIYNLHLARGRVQGPYWLLCGLVQIPRWLLGSLVQIPHWLLGILVQIPHWLLCFWSRFLIGCCVSGPDSSLAAVLLVSILYGRSVLKGQSYLIFNPSIAQNTPLGPLTNRQQNVLNFFVFAKIFACKITH